MMHTTDSVQQGYNDYQDMVRKTSQSISDLSRICDKLGIEQQKNALQSSADKLHKKTFTVGIVGSFRKGKSTVINALLGQEVVPSDIVPTSATLNYIKWGTTPSAVVNFKDGRIEEVPVGEIKKYITKITDESAAVAATVDKSVIYYPCKFCQNNVEIVDTPGLEDDAEMDKVTESVIPYLDAIILVVVPGHPFGHEEAKFVRTKIMTSAIGRMLVVVNKIDEMETQAERERIIAEVKKRFQRSVLEKIGQAVEPKGAENKVGNLNISDISARNDFKFDEMKTQDECKRIVAEVEERFQRSILEKIGQDVDSKDAKSKVGNLNIIGISARNALRGKQSGDNAKFKESNFQELEKSLSCILNEERGILELIAPVSMVLSTAREIRSIIEMRLKAIDMDVEKLTELTDRGIAEAQHSREVAEKEIAELNKSAKNLYRELLPDVVEMYSFAEKDMMKYVSEIEIDSSDISDEDGIENKLKEIREKMKEEIKQRLSTSAEKLAVRIQEKINDEVSNFNTKAEKIFGGIGKVQADFSSTVRTDKTFDWGVAAIDALTNISSMLGLGIFGIGGVISGFRQKGFTGAVVGGAAGFATGYAATCAVAAAGASIIGLPILIPALAVGGIVSTFGGKFAVNKIFSHSIGEQNIVKVRSQLQNSVVDAMKSVREAMVLENWLSKATSEAYQYLTDKLTADTQNVLSDFEHTMRQISLDKQKQQSEIDATRASLEEMDKRLTEIADTISPVKAKLAQALGPGYVKQEGNHELSENRNITVE